MSTIKQEKALKQIIENHGNISKAMRDVGYEENTVKNPKNLTDSKGFKELLAKIDDQPLLDRLNDIALQGSERSSISAIKEVLTLKDRYPAGKIKINQYQDELEQLDKEE